MGALLCVSNTAGAQQLPDSTARRQQRTLDSLSAALAAVHARLDSLAAKPSAPPMAPMRASGAYMNVSFVGLTGFDWSTTKAVSSLQVGDHELMRGGHIAVVAQPASEHKLLRTAEQGMTHHLGNVPIKLRT